MTTKVEKGGKVAEPPKKPEDKFDPSVYSCEIIQEIQSNQLYREYH